jgi:hypothetical protein
MLLLRHPAGSVNRFAKRAPPLHSMQINVLSLHPWLLETSTFFACGPHVQDSVKYTCGRKPAEDKATTNTQPTEVLALGRSTYKYILVLVLFCLPSRQSLTVTWCSSSELTVRCNGLEQCTSSHIFFWVLQRTVGAEWKWRGVLGRSFRYGGRTDGVAALWPGRSRDFDYGPERGESVTAESVRPFLTRTHERWGNRQHASTQSEHVATRYCVFKINGHGPGQFS